MSEQDKELKINLKNFLNLIHNSINDHETEVFNLWNVSLLSFCVPKKNYYKSSHKHDRNDDDHI